MYRSAIEHCKEIFGYWPPQKFEAQTIYFRRLRNSMANLRVNISPEEHDRDNRGTELETTTSSLNRLKISWNSSKIGPSFYPPSKNFPFFFIAGLRRRSLADRTQPSFATVESKQGTGRGTEVRVLHPIPHQKLELNPAQRYHWQRTKA